MLHAFRVAALPMSCVIRFEIGRSGADRDTQLIFSSPNVLTRIDKSNPRHQQSRVLGFFWNVEQKHRTDILFE